MKTINDLKNEGVKLRWPFLDFPSKGETFLECSRTHGFCGYRIIVEAKLEEDVECPVCGHVLWEFEV